MKPPARCPRPGAGASRGFTHIGVLKILEANRVPMHLIVAPAQEALSGVFMHTLQRVPAPESLLFH